MNTLVVLIILGVFITVDTFDSDFHFDDDTRSKHEDISLYIPDGEGIPNIVRLKTHQMQTNTIPKNGDIYNKIPRDKIEVRYFLYTRKSPMFPEELSPDPQTFQKSSIDLSKPIKILIHGWKTNIQSDFNQKLKTKYLETKDCNVIIVDWSTIADLSYMTAAMSTNQIGEDVTKFLKFVVNNGGKFNQIHLIGHSLGAHICGSVGYNLNGKIHRITGLDPASPLFDTIMNDGSKLTSDDAHFVDVIHTCGGVLGFSYSIGTVDFYPNGGVPIQPGCPTEEIWSESCSHSRAWEYFEESIGNPKAFLAVQCESWETFERNGSFDGCQDNMIIPMGEDTPITTHGNFYLRTSNTTPFHAIHT